jgi:hypothetical protein
MLELFHSREPRTRIDAPWIRITRGNPWAPTFTGSIAAVTAFLALLEKDMKDQPERITHLSMQSVARANRLTKR